MYDREIGYNTIVQCENTETATVVVHVHCSVEPHLQYLHLNYPAAQIIQHWTAGCSN